MRKLCFLVIALSLFCSANVIAEPMYAIDSSRTSLNNGTVSEADTVKSDSSKLSVRGDYKAAKSWIKFDISGLDVSAMTSCKLRVTLNDNKSSSCSVSAVNDGIGSSVVLDGSVTWNTAPGNITSADGVNPDDGSFTVDDLQDNLDPAQTTLIGTIDYTNGLAGQQYTIEVLPVLQADTDGIVLFVLHGAGGSTNFATHDNSNGAEYHPALVYETLQAGDCADVGILVSTFADQSCRTELFDGTNPRVDDNREDNNKLSVRGDNKASKSWIKFDINDLGITDPNSLKSATLRITLYEPKSNTCRLSYVNDDCTANIDWTDADLTWNNAPGNITSSDGINPNDGSYSIDDLQDNLDPSKTTEIGTVDYSYGGQSGDQFEFDVLQVLQNDTDGIVQFVLHGAGGYTTFATHDNTLGEEYWPMLTILLPPTGADNPNPCPGETVSSDLAGLSWTNPDPNNPADSIVPTVYYGTEPNRLQMDHVTLNPGSQGVLISATFGTLSEGEYWWAVDCYDTGTGQTIEGMMWDFTVYNNQAPYNVDAGINQAIWLTDTSSVSLAGSAEDDGLPADPGVLTYNWEQTAGPLTAVINTPDAASTTVDFTERGDYTFTFTADDSELQTSAGVRVVVGDTACDASHILDGSGYDPGDVNLDCIVNLDDFAALIAVNWLDCTNDLTGCN